LSKKKQTLLLAIRIASDLFMVGAAWIAAYLLRFYSVFEIYKGVPQEVLYLKLLPFILVIWFIVLSAAGFYKRSMKIRSAFLEGLDIVQSCVLATLAFIAFTYFYEEYRYSRLTLLLFAMIHPFFIIAGRSIIRKALRVYRRKHPPRGMLVIGSGDLLQQAIVLSANADFEQTKVTSVILVGDEEEVRKSAEYCREHSIDVSTIPTDWADFFMRFNIKSVYFAVPHNWYSFLEKHLVEITNQVTDVKIIPDVLRYTKFAAGIDIVYGVPVVSIHESPLEGMGSVVKRLVDIIGALTALIIAAPMMLILAVLVKLSSKGPVLYGQERMGLDGKTFSCLKFRSMPTTAEAGTGPVWAKANEDRATPLGKFLRKYSLDELPQFFNVLMGDMSLVGPRPERPVFVSEFRRKVPGYMLRHKVKAGITGWAQVNGWRGNTSLEKRIECDLFYIQNWSLWLDLRILGKTFAEVVFSRNAY
jgi:Undecaprenyl-phosphate glucose phosphotransferase